MPWILRGRKRAHGFASTCRSAILGRAMPRAGALAQTCGHCLAGAAALGWREKLVGGKNKTNGQGPTWCNAHLAETNSCNHSSLIIWNQPTPCLKYIHVRWAKIFVGGITQHGGERGTACISDAAHAKVEAIERLEHSFHGLGDQGSQALVTNLVAPHGEARELWQLAQHRSQCYYAHVPDLVLAEHKLLYRGHCPFGEGGGEGVGGQVSDLRRLKSEKAERRQTAATETRCQ
eukprot:scaffold43634_cov64-Phaeocystis_antarctica.AAC.15